MAVPVQVDCGRLPCWDLCWAEEVMVVVRGAVEILAEVGFREAEAPVTHGKKH